MVKPAARFAYFVRLMVLVVLLTGCAPAPDPVVTNLPTQPEATPLATSTMPLPTLAWTLTPTPSPEPSPTSTPTQAPSATPTPTPSPTLTPTWAYLEAGRVVAPILLYHHIAQNGENNRYFVSPENFRAQMQYLRDLGYTSVTPSYLVSVLMRGGDLPERPVVITFDDGNMDVYENAFPVMQEMGFVGAFYIVANRLEADGFVGVEELTAMINAGWEVGSHSMSHVDLASNHSLARQEILQSRLDLEEALEVPVKIMAYPFGLVDDTVFEKTLDYGYLAGMGLGNFNEHTWGTLYYLARREVHYEYDLAAFGALLPWQSPAGSP